MTQADRLLRCLQNANHSVVSDRALISVMRKRLLPGEPDDLDQTMLRIRMTQLRELGWTITRVRRFGFFLVDVPGPEQRRIAA